MVDVYIAAGSNIEPEKYMRRALQALRKRFGALVISPAYRNKAVGFEGADFVNLVVRFSTDESVTAVRQALQDIEASCERPRPAPKWAARTMDLDILLYGTMVSDEPGLQLPRPDLIRRSYVLKPMVDLAPDLIHPTLHESMRELWQALAFEESDHPLVEVTILGSDLRLPPESGR